MPKYVLGIDFGTLSGRAAVVARTARAISLERAVVLGESPSEPEADQLVEELCENLRALLRDLICGHLDAEVVWLADELLAEALPATSG